MTCDSEDLSVKILEERLFELFPRFQAEDWDHVGLSVGNPASSVRGVACALDVTPDSIRLARDRGANVLLTHHPVCLAMPGVISPAESGAPTPSSSIWEAVRCDVALIAMHTNLDRSEQAALRLPTLLGLSAVAGIEQGRPKSDGSLGALSDISASSETLGELARRCHRSFGRPVQVYGDASRQIRRVAFYSGSLGSEGIEDVRACGADAVVCGECGYHRSIDLVSGGCAVIILGHDVSELPHVACLRDAAISCGVAARSVFVIDEPQRWASL